MGAPEPPPRIPVMSRRAVARPSQGRCMAREYRLRRDEPTTLSIASRRTAMREDVADKAQYAHTASPWFLDHLRQPVLAAS
jgi:hypothetical protein